MGKGRMGVVVVGGGGGEGVVFELIIRHHTYHYTCFIDQLANTFCLKLDPILFCH